MRPVTTSALQRWTQSLLHTHDTPERTAFAFALGVAIGFSPFLGFHVAIGLALAFLLNLNRVAVLAGVVLNLPWLIGIYYAAATAFGAWLTSTPMPPHFVSRLEAIAATPGWFNRLAALRQLLEPLLGAYILGSTVGALALGLAAYVVTLPLLRTVARKRLI